MDRARRLREVWSWLPVFRAAAETEHLPSASRQLRVTRSSISRAIRLLEDSVGARLFDREGRTMRLNGRGHTVLSAVRDAMRLLDEAIADVTGESLRGVVDVSAPTDFTEALVLPAIAEVTGAHPDLIPRVHHVETDSLAARLLRGRLDVAITDTPIEHDDLRLERLVLLERTVYGTGDRYAASPRDGWPPERPRAVAAQLSTLREAAALSARAGLCAALPSVIARAENLPHKRRTPALPPLSIYAVYRRPLGEHPRTDAMLAALRDAAAQLTAEN